MAEPLTLKSRPDLPDPPVFIRSIARARVWTQALQTKQPSDAAELLYEPDDNVSLWRVQDDEELRRVALAINESRDSLRETLDLLPILPAELQDVGIDWDAELGETACPTAARLHFSAEINSEARLRLLQRLIEANRELLRCTGGKMRLAVELSAKDGCFTAVPESVECACGETR
jgi:hypothetical protein